MKEKLTNSEIKELASQMKIISSKIEDLLSILKDQDYIRIGENGDIWTGDAADTAHQTFEDLVAKFPDFISSVNEYSDYLVNDLTER